jgi:D-glycero-alpha-D-manno-heptose-7-phosphate kinase
VILARAPLRIPLGGGGTDLPSYYERRGGFVLSAAINKYVYIYVNRPAADNLLRLKYSKYEQVERLEDIEHDLVRPALELLDVRGNLEIVSMADVPDGTGLGSSGSYLVGLLTALYEFKREKVPTQALAETACHIEMDLAAHPVGKHDHYMAAFGGMTTLDIHPDGRVHVSPLDISIPTVEELKSGTLLFYTGIRRSSKDILGAQKADTQRGDATVMDSLDRTKELGLRIRDALVQGDLDAYGHMLDEHWQNKKRRSAKVSDAQIDRWYDLARRSGALGGKIMGAGGGGFLLLYCPREVKPAVRQALAGEGLREMPFDFDFEGAKVLVNF